MKLYVPPGIGDISWIYSKVKHWIDQGVPMEFVVEEQDPRRSEAFVNLLPDVTFGGYAEVPGHVRITSIDIPPCDGEYAIMNHFLESGNSLSRIWPDLKTDYHYRLNTNEDDVGAAVDLLGTRTTPVFGLYCSSRNHRDNGLWSVDEWVEFVERVSEGRSVRWACLGAEYDDKTREVCDRIGALNGVGNLGLGATIETIRRLDYFFAFPSGLGILADVVQTPCTMWYWGGNRFCANGRASYADPKSEHHTVRTYSTVKAEAQAWIDRYGKGYK